MTTTQKLNLTPEELEAIFYIKYAKWCTSVTLNNLEFQKVLANAKINRWFRMEYAKCEAEFELLTNRYEDSLTVSSRDYTQCYDACLDHLYNIRPTAMLQEIKKTKFSAVMDIMGFLVPSLTFRSN
jgi:hypothetical protein